MKMYWACDETSLSSTGGMNSIMKKIGILTYHRVFNFGSLLQTYALQHYLEGKSCNVEVIDYYPSRLQKKELLFHVNPKWRKPFYKMVAHLIPAVISRLLGYKMMDDFLKNYVKLTDKTYETADDLSKNVPVEDIYMNGSDQIWNVDTAGGTVDEVFFMNFLSDNAVRTAYAGSFGKDDFNEDDIKKIGKRLEKYRAISVREKSGLSILEKAGIENGKWVLDPTFLLKADEWLKIAKSVRLPEHYVLVYNLNRNPRITELAVKIAGQKNIPIVNFAHSFVFIKGAKNIVYPTPNSFITMFANADYVVTDSFHGTAFSINFNRQFICIPAPRFNSRLESILELVGLEERLLWEQDDFEIINRKIDYSKINSVIECERRKSDKFIQEILRLQSASC